ncbi:uncharacterized protein LOC111044482 isoform X2 [Nilaparvata lugens]|uniref:uncharacterized protein LOC111044482 isoform X2 n=1 Tax=Nilaparvata lugens TaxID=108931 RepID=UPI00193D53AB|nr:uncharacterized protein LOC111044482 isoform X2 [Nilaparvata lugens]
MDLSIYCLLLMSASILVGISDCSEMNGDLSLFLERRLQEARTQLNRIVMDANGFLLKRSKRDPLRPSISFDKLIENNTAIVGEIYHHFDNILVLDREIINKIDKKHLQHLVVLCGDCLKIDFRRVTFIEVTKKHPHTMFIVLGMDDGFLNLFSIKHNHHFDHKYELLQSIPPPRVNSFYPVDGKFFTESGHIFFYVVYTKSNGESSESILFKLRKSYLDKEYSNILTHGAKSVASFSSGTSQIIIIAEATNRKVSSQVLRFSHSKKRLERIQLLETKRPESVKHFRAFESNFVLVCEQTSPSTIYWWNDGEFLKWLDVPFMYGNCLFSIKQVNDQTLFLNTLQNDTTIYSLGWKHMREIATVPRPVNDDQKIINLFISTGNITRLNIVGILPKSIRFSMWDLTLHFPDLTGGEGRSIVEDRLSECFGKAEGNLGVISKRINDTNDLINNRLIKLDQNLRFDSIKVVGQNSSVRLRNGTVERLDLSYMDGKSTTDNDIDELLATSDKFIQSSIIDRVDVIFKSNLTIKNANLKLASAHRFNNRELNREEFIWLDKDQQLEILNVSDVTTGELLTENLAGKQTEHFILKPTLNSGQTLNLGSLNCKDIHSKTKSINGINLEQLVMKNHNKTIHGGKYFQAVEVDQLQNLGAKTNNQSHSQKNENEDLSRGSEAFKLKANTIIDNLIVEHINGINVDELIDNIVLNNTEATIDTALIFANDMKVDLLRGNLIISQSTNSAIRPYPILSKRQFSSENEEGENSEEDCVIGQEFQDDSEDTGTKSRSIFQPKFPRYNFGRDIHVKGNIKADEFICKSCKVVIQNQSFPIGDVERIFWTYNTKQNITAPTIINSSVTANEAIEVTFINEKKMDCILDEKNDRAFKPKFIFKNVTAKGDVIDSSDSSHAGFNAKQLNDSIVRSSDTQYIKNKKNFNGGVSVNYLKAEQLEQRQSPELVSRSQRKSIEEGSGADDERPLKFVVDGDLIVREDLEIIYYNDIDVESKLKSAAYNDEDCHLERIQFKNLETDNINTGSLNGESVEKGMSLMRPHFKIHRAEMFDISKPLHLHHVTYMNDINVHEHLPKVVNMSGNTLIRGKKIFKSLPIVANDLHTERINDVNMKDIYKNAFSRSKQQHIKQPTKIVNHSSFRALHTEEVNGIDASRLIDVSQDGNSENGSITLDADLIFKKLSVVGNVEVADSCKIDSTGQMRFQNMHIIGNVSWRNDENNKPKIWTMLKNAVTADKTNNITGKVVFNGDVTMKQVRHTDDKLINNINLSHIMKDSLMLNKNNQIVTGEKVFLHHMSCNFMTVTADLLANHINQENILEFNKTLVRKYSTDIVEGHKYFENGFSAFSLKTKGGVGGMQLDDIVLTSSNRSLPETVFEDLEIVKNLDTETYNNIDLDKFLKERFLISKGTHQVFNGSILFKDSVTFKGESLVGTLNNVNIDNIVLTEGTPAASAKPVDGCKTFNNPFKTEGIINTEKFNNENFRRLNKCATLYDEPSTLKGSLVFENDVEVDNELWAQTYCIEGISINLTNAVESFKKTTGYKFNDEV